MSNPLVLMPLFNYEGFLGGVTANAPRAKVTDRKAPAITIKDMCVKDNNI